MYIVLMNNEITEYGWLYKTCRFKEKVAIQAKEYDSGNREELEKVFISSIYLWR